MSDLLGGIASALGGIGATYLSHNLGGQAAEKQYYLNKKAVDYQNAYNHPKAQMQRLAEAGLNPKSLGDGMTQPSGSFSVAAPQPGKATNPVAEAIDYAVSLANIDNIEAMTRSHEAAANKTRVDTLLSGQDFILNGLDIKHYLQTGYRQNMSPLNMAAAAVAKFFAGSGIPGPAALGAAVSSLGNTVGGAVYDAKEAASAAIKRAVGKASDKGKSYINKGKSYINTVRAAAQRVRGFNR